MVTENILSRVQVFGAGVTFRGDCGMIPKKCVISPGSIVDTLQHGRIVSSAYIQRHSIPPAARRVFGEPHAWNAMGMEGGHAWAMFADDGELHLLKRGDKLVIHADELKAIVRWKGRIEPDASANVAERGPGWVHLQALGRWVCWVQPGEAPDAWARHFFQQPRLRACLVWMGVGESPWNHTTHGLSRTAFRHESPSSSRTSKQRSSIYHEKENQPQSPS